MKNYLNVSLIIPNYNGEKFLENCLQSLNLHNKNDYEIIIVDNNSSDMSQEIISTFENIRTIRLNQNYGFSRAVNEGIKAAKGEYVILLNNDTEIEKGFIENLFNCIKVDDSIFSCCSRMIQYKDKSKIDDVGDEYTILGWAYKRGDNKSINLYNKNKEVFSSCAGAAIYRKEVFDKIGYFDEAFFAYMEDVDISYRARIFGYKNIYCSDAVVYHLGSATSGSKYNSFKVKLAARNNIFVVYKNMPILQLIFNLPFLLVGFLIKIIFYFKKGFGKDYMDGLVEGLTSLNKVKKIKFNIKNLPSYLKIEVYLVINTVRYIALKLFKVNSI